MDRCSPPTRRSVLLGTAAALATAARPAAAAEAGHLLVPGYAPQHAVQGGRPLAEHPAWRRFLPPGHDGPVTLLARIDLGSGEVRRVLLPLAGHHVCTLRDQRLVFAPMHGLSAAVVDAATMEPVDWFSPHAPDYMFGGHSLSLGDSVVTAERPREPLDAGRRPRRGRLVVRDAASLLPLEAYDCHGFAPHDLASLDDDAHVAVANYGSVVAEGDAGEPVAIEPSVSLIDIRSGRLADKRIAEGPFELRHLAVAERGQILGLRTHAVAATDDLRVRYGEERLDMADRSAPAGIFYRPVPPLQLTGPQRLSPAIGAEVLDLMRYGQSVCADPRHGEFLVTFAATHRLMVFDAASGAVRRVIDTRDLGIRHPRGVALLADGRTYALTGSWSGLAVLDRGTHRARTEEARHIPFFEHSHVTAAGSPAG